MSCGTVANHGQPSLLLVHAELCGGDLIVLRIDGKGGVLPPLIIFQDAYWNSDNFRRIIEKERARMHSKVEVEFWKDENSQSFLYKCFGSEGYLVRGDVQACIILPLDSKLETADPETASLLDLLDLPTLLEEARSEIKISCICGKADRKESNMMILCDSTKCKYGWYHMNCVGLKDSFKSMEWYCESCKVLSENDRVRTTYDNGEFDADTYQASDERIQLARTMWKVWREHSKPTLAKILKAVQKMQKASDWEVKSSIQMLVEEGYFEPLRCRISQSIEGHRTGIGGQE
jgi:hypothetical protein